MSLSYFLFLPPDRVVGPHTFDRLREWVAVGALSPDSQVCVSGSEAWTEFRNLPRCDSLTAAIRRRIASRLAALKPQWHSDPVTPKQLARLEYFQIPFERQMLTKARASELIDCFVAIDPDLEEQYQGQPIGEEQKGELMALGIETFGTTRAQARSLFSDARDQLRLQAEEQQLKAEQLEIELMLLDSLLNDPDVFEICRIKRISRRKLGALLPKLDHDFPNWRDVNRFELGDYVFLHFPDFR